jgi:hypothetical protein
MEGEETTDGGRLDGPEVPELDRADQTQRTTPLVVGDQPAVVSGDHGQHEQVATGTVRIVPLVAVLFDDQDELGVRAPPVRGPRGRQRRHLTVESEGVGRQGHAGEVHGPVPPAFRGPVVGVGERAGDGVRIGLPEPGGDPLQRRVDAVGVGDAGRFG